MRVLIVGCGYVGAKLGALLASDGHAVFGLNRTLTLAAALNSVGIIPLSGDVTKPETLRTLPSGFDWVVNCVSASGGSAADYQQVYIDGTRHLLSWLSESPPQRFLYTSSTGVYGQLDGSSVDEFAPTIPPSFRGQILIEAERLLCGAAREHGFPAVILRVAGIYGPGRSYWLEQVQSGAARVEGQRFLNMIHRDDVAGAIIAGLKRGKAGDIYNAVDDAPVPQCVLVEWLSAQLGLTVSKQLGAAQDTLRNRGLTNKAVMNRKLKEQLGYCFQFPTFREGFASLLALPSDFSPKAKRKSGN